MAHSLRSWFVALLVLAGMLGGCAATGPVGSPAMREWIGQQGGVIRDQRTQRAQALADALVAKTIGRSVQVHVLDNAATTAYSWPDGELFVTAGLMDRFTDAEITATLAHELGHLLNDGHLKTHLALQGREDSDVEEGADRTACLLLQQCGVPRTALISALEKVRQTVTSASCRQAMGRRIELVRSYQ